MMGRIAWRNLWRNRTRTGIMVSAIALSYGLMLVLFGIADYSYQEMGDATVAAVGGHVLVHGDGYWDLPTGGQVVGDPKRVRALGEEMPEVEAMAERVMVFGLVSTADATEAVQVMGIRPDEERHFFDPVDQLVEGEFLSGERENGIVLARETAEILGVGIGDRVVVTATDLDGEMTRGLFFVDGLLRSTPGQAGESRAFTSLEDLQRTLGYGEAVTQVGLRLSDDRHRDRIAIALEGHLRAEDLEVLTWDEAVPELVAMIEFDQAFTYIYVLVIMFIVVLGITNTFLMAVMERVREIGLMSALGLTPRRLGSLIVIETMLVTAVSMAIGFGLGLMGHYWMVAYGIDLTMMLGDLEMELAGVSLEMAMIHSHLDPMRWFVGSVVVFVFVCLSAIYPAVKATRLAPAEAMRFYE